MKTKPNTFNIGRSIGNNLAINACLAFGYVVAMRWAGHEMVFPTAVLVVALLLVQFVFAVYQTQALYDMPEPSADTPTDPWDMQRDLMAASGQNLPPRPTFDKGVLLYAALLMEELGETLVGLQKASQRIALRTDVPDAERFTLKTVHGLLTYNADMLQAESMNLRQIIKGLTRGYALLASEATEILDGTTDVAVVNAGFALACGLPGAAAYQEVACSNLSKANPATGVIDKTVDGKWIKGSQYFEPDLAKVLFQHIREHVEEGPQ